MAACLVLIWVGVRCENCNWDQSCEYCNNGLAILNWRQTFRWGSGLWKRRNFIADSIMMHITWLGDYAQGLYVWFITCKYMHWIFGDAINFVWAPERISALLNIHTIKFVTSHPVLKWSNSVILIHHNTQIKQTSYIVDIIELEISTITLVCACHVSICWTCDKLKSYIMHLFLVSSCSSLMFIIYT